MIFQGLFGIIFMWEGQVNQNKPVTFLLRSFFRIFLLTSGQFLCTRFFHNSIHLGDFMFTNSIDLVLYVTGKTAA